MGARVTVEFRLLGEVEAAVDGMPITIGFAQLRCLLAVLLVEANHIVSVDQLLDRAWRPHRLPRHPRDAVHQRIALVQEIWDTIAAEPHPPLLTEAQRRELERRVAEDDANPNDVVSWEQVKAQALSRLR